MLRSASDPHGRWHAARATARRWLRAEASETQLGLTLTFVAGAINAGGFMIVGQYTSHMSGIVSAMADHVALGMGQVVLAGLLALASFMAGAAHSAWLINLGRRLGWRSRYALPLLVEAALLLAFGIMGALLPAELVAIPVVPLLCFLMGVQNACITKISGARMRTTHVTGIVTDLGIEIGKLTYWNADARSDAPKVFADRAKMRLLAGLLACFTVGGVIGALAFARMGLAACMPLAVVLLILANAVIPAEAE
ncbi:YoaK family protein [Roseomonas sp. CAU 1739]|uniref:YoaK family protein n=1 Tax=Roseomonas sp. CAU 1739 TaxID=3140364 RepID=UPI00325BBD0F